MSAMRVRCLTLSMFVVGFLVLGAANRPMAAGGDAGAVARQIIVPAEDRFTPFPITIRVGQKVTWINNDTDAHTVTSDDAFNTAGHRGVNKLLKGNGGKFTLTFNHPGVFPFYCQFH